MGIDVELAESGFCLTSAAVASVSEHTLTIYARPGQFHKFSFAVHEHTHRIPKTIILLICSLMRPGFFIDTTFGSEWVYPS